MNTTTKGIRWIRAAALTVLAVWIVSAAAAPVLSPFDPNEQNLELRFAPMRTQGHVLGTDSLGRDTLSRLLYGARGAFFVGAGAILISSIAGAFFGVLGGFLLPRLSRVLSTLSDAVLAVPMVVLSLALITAFGPGQTQVVVSLGIVFTPLFYRVVTAEVLHARSEGWVDAARSLGTSPGRIVLFHIFPQVVPALLIQATSLFSLAISLEASLSFLGIGTQPPQASWGLMLQEAREYLFTAWHLALPPGLYLAAVVLCLNVIGDVLAETFKRT